MINVPKVRPEVKTEELAEVIKAKGIKLRYLADAIGVHESTLQRKLKNEQEFKLSEIVRISCALSLTDAERDYLFSLHG
jgi:transcriptional regulator with XRE-family HTH domain